MVTPSIIVFTTQFNHLNLEQICSRFELCQLHELSQLAVYCLDLYEPTEDALKELVSVVEHILTDDQLVARDSVRFGHFNLFFVASLDDIDSMNRSHSWVQIAKSHLYSLPQIPRGIQFDAIGLFLNNIPLERDNDKNPAPQKRSYARHYAWLREVIGGRAFDRVFFITTTNFDTVYNPQGFPRLRPHELEDLAIELLVNFTTTDMLMHVDAVMGDIAQSPVFCSAGAASVIFPINALIKQHGSRFAADLIGYYTKNEKQSSDEEVFGFLDGNEITYRVLCEQLMNTGTPGETVISRLHFEPLIFKAVPLESLPERIASYGDYLAREKVRLLIKQIDENLEKMKEKALGKLINRVDALIVNAGEPSTVKPLDFLKRLWHKLKEEKNLADSFLIPEKLEDIYDKPKKKKDQVVLPSEQECHDRLVHSLKNRQLMFPVLARYGLLGLVVAYGIQLVISFWGKHPFFVDLGIFSNPFLWFYPVWGLFIFAGVFKLFQAMRIIRRRRIEYERAILKRLRGIVYAHMNEAIHKFYNHLLSYTGDPESAEAPEGSERRKIQDFKTLLGQIAKEFKEEKFDFPESMFCIPAVKYLDPGLNFFYKNNQKVNWEMEMSECGKRGLFIVWRKTLEGKDAAETRQSLKTTLWQYGQEGFWYTRNQSLLQRLHTRLQEPEHYGQLSQLWDLLKTRSFFCLSLNNLPQAPVQSVFYLLSDENLLDQLLGEDNNNIQRLGDNDGFRLGICQVMWGCALKESTLIQRWKIDYDQCDDKNSLHKIQDWQNLPDPFQNVSQKEGDSNDRTKHEEPIL
jgi:hypothetical protein